MKTPLSYYGGKQQLAGKIISMGVIDDVCPGCGRSEGGVRFERIRRITGYLVGTLDRFNDAKKAEEHDRVHHTGSH